MTGVGETCPKSVSVTAADRESTEMAGGDDKTAAAAAGTEPVTPAGSDRRKGLDPVVKPPPEDMPSFDEWKQKEQEKAKNSTG